MRSYARPAAPIVALDLVLALPASTATGKSPPCAAAKVKVGGLCVKPTINGSKGYVQITAVRIPYPSGPRRRVVTVRLNGPFTLACSDGSTEQVSAVGGPGIYWPISGSSFGGTKDSGRRTLHGHWAAANKAVIDTYSDTKVSYNKTCRLQITNFTIKG
jgi:hypothetical protein